MDIVKFSEFSSVSWYRKILEFCHSLSPEISPIDEKKDSFCSCMLNEPIGNITESEGFPCSCCHLYKCTRTIICKRSFEIFNSFYLYFSQSFVIERREYSKKCERLFWKFNIVTKCFWTMKCKNFSTSCIWFEIVRESSFNTSRLV